MALTVANPIVGTLTPEDKRIWVKGELAVISLYLSEGKYGYVAFWGDRLFVQQPVYMTEDKATSEAVVEMMMAHYQEQAS